MTADQVFRGLLLVATVAMIAVEIGVRWRAYTPGERIDRREEGMFIMVVMRIFGILFFAGQFAWLFRPALMAWSAVSLPIWLRALGVVLGAAGCLLMLWTYYSLDRNLTDTVVIRSKNQLVTSGPYRWLRHPLYLAWLMGFWAVSLVTANWCLLILGMITFAFMVRRTDIEEAKLLARYGEEYQEYMNRSGRFLPRPAIARRRPAKSAVH